MINFLSGSALDSSFNIYMNIYILAALKRLFLERKNKEEIEGVHERNLQNSRLNIVSAIFHFFTK